jgi:hypothetical protein
LIPDMKVSFHIKSKYLSPDEITHFLGLQPTKVFNIGDLMGKKSINKAKVNIWIYSTEKPIPSFDINAYLTPLLDSLETKKDLISKLSQEQDVHCIIECPIWIEDETPILCLTPRIMQRIIELNAEIDFDLYV